MASILPTVPYPGLEYVTAGNPVTADSIVIPMNALPALTPAEADPIAGDGREVVRALQEAAATNILALTPGNAPTEMIVSKAQPQAQGIDTVRQGYTFQFDITYDSNTVVMTPEA